MIFNNLWRRATRSLLTVLGIAIGVAAVVALGAMAQGIGKNYGNALGLSNDLLVTQANTYDVIFSSLDEDLDQRIQAIPDVTNVEPGVFSWIVVGDTPYFLIYGYPVGSVAMAHYRIVEGKPVTGPGQIAVGRRGADALDLGVDGTLRVKGVPYRIVGIYETGQGMEESGGVVTLEDAQTIAAKSRKVSLFQVGLHPAADLAQVIQRIEALDKQITVSTASDYQSGQDWTALLQGFAWSIAAIAILIGGLGMMSAMVMSVLERTREIGTLRAVGWRRRRILGQILQESLLLCLLAGLLGSALGVLLLTGLTSIPGVARMMQASWRVEIFVSAIGIALLLGLLGGLYPAWRASRLQPVEALRYE